MLAPKPKAPRMAERGAWVSEERESWLLSAWVSTVTSTDNPPRPAGLLSPRLPGEGALALLAAGGGGMVGWEDEEVAAALLPDAAKLGPSPPRFRLLDNG